MSDNTQAFEREISIQVRSPSLDETLNVQTKLSATVLSLKEAIFSIHPTHPIAENQRIIYSGKLLQDNELLSTVIKNFDVEVTPTFHLVVKPSLQPQQQRLPQPQQTETPYSDQHVSPPTPEQVGSTQPTFEIPSSLPRFEAPQYQTPTPRYTTQSVLPGGYQVVFINGQYYLAPVLTVTQPIPDFSFSSAYLEQPANNQPQPIYHQVPDQAQTQPQQAQQPAAAAAAAAPVVALPNAQRAASIWLALKLVVVLFMVCQDASIERIFIFHFIAFVFFLYQTNRLRFVLRRVRAEDLNNRFRFAGQRAAPPVQPQQPPQQNDGVSTGVNNNNNQENLTQRRGQQNNEEATPTPTATVETPVRPPTFLDACKRGAFTFFASLWPTYGQDARIAQAFENENEREGLEEF